MIRRILRYIGFTLLAMVVALNLFSLQQRLVEKNPFPMLFGYGTGIVASGSMEPALSWGDLLVVREEPEYAEGEIITFIEPGDERSTTHRVSAVSTEGYVTKGDANNVEDESITKDQVFGRVILAVPFVGQVVRFIRSPLGILLIITILVSWILWDRRKARE